MKKTKLILIALLAMPLAAAAQGKTLRQTVGRDCLIGVAINQWQHTGRNQKVNHIIDTQFNQLVAENCMKPEVLQPVEGVFDFAQADRFIAYAQEHKQTVIGHNLVWHSQSPRWWHEGNPTKEVMAKRLTDHIKAVVGHFKGKVHGWDVINEAILDDGSYRPTDYYKLLGDSLFEIIFQAAHEADPNVELYYNDFSMSGAKKRATVCALVKRLKAHGCRIDAVGMQSHNGLDYPDLGEYEKSIEAFAACGVKVMMTELDVNVLPNPEGFNGAAIDQDYVYQKKYNPYTEGIPADKQAEINQRWKDLFEIYYRHRKDISRITLWGIDDGESWLNGFPVRGRTNYPLLFDRQYNPKPAVEIITELWK